MKNKRLWVIGFAAIAMNAYAAPEGYIEAAANDGTIWYIHPAVSVRPMKKDPSDINVLADIWEEMGNSSGSGYKQAFNCKEAGVSFSVIPSGDGGFSRGKQTNFVRGSIGFTLWTYACAFSKK